MRHAAILMFVCVSVLLVGCAQQRAVSIVRRDADRSAHREQYDAALMDYQEVVDRDPSDWVYRLKLADTLVTLKRFDAAIEHYAVVLGVRPDDRAVIEKYTNAMYQAGRHDRLISYLTHRAKDTGAVADYLQLGWYSAKVGDADLAQRALLTAARLDHGASVAPYLALADFYNAAGDHDAALRQLRIATGIDPANTTVQEKIRAMGEIPGPSFALTPDEN